MTAKSPGESSGNPLLDQLLAEFLRAAEAGHSPDPQSLIRQHPELADELRSFFANRAAIERLAEPLRNADLDLTVDITEGNQPAGNRNAGDLASDFQRVRYFGDYELLEELGRGGMGVVYKARQATLNRLVALKMIIAGQLAAPEDVQRFKQEAEAAANLDHPHIAPIYETGEHHGQHYFSMKLIEGRSLRDALPELRDEIRAGVKLLAQVARAVHHAHQRGVLHRDLKPANVLLDRAGTAYVTDFGLAKRVEGDSDVTKTGAIVGTPSYMAPEQAKGEKQLSTAVDVYSVGVMLYELLTGRPPFRADSPVETLMLVLAGNAARPRSLNPQANRDLETICLKCLERDAVKRYDSAAALADELERWLRGDPIAARPVGGLERVWRWCQRNSALAATILASSVLVLILSGAYLAGIVSKNAQLSSAFNSERDARQAEAAQRQLAETSASEAIQEKDRADEEKLRAQRHLYVARMNLVNRALEAGNLQIAEKLLENYAAGTGVEHLRGFEWFYWKHLLETVRLEATLFMYGGWMQVSSDGSRVAISEIAPQSAKPFGLYVFDIKRGSNIGPLTTPRELVHLAGPLAISPDGRRLAVATFERAQITILNVDTNAKVAEITADSPVRNMAFAPDGRTFAATVDKQIVIFDATSGESRRTLPTSGTGLWSVAFDTTGNQLVAGGRDGAIHVWNLKTEAEPISIAAHRDIVTALVFSPDTKTLISSSRDGTIVCWDLASQKRLRTIAADRPEWLSLSADGKTLLAGNFAGFVQVMDTQTGDPILRVMADVTFLSGLGCLPASEKFLTVGGSLKTWYLARNDARTLLPDTTTVLAIAPDGQTLASGSHLRSLKTDKVIPLKVKDAILCTAFSRLGDRVATGSNQGKINIWNAANAKHLLSLEGVSLHVRTLDFAPDGTALATGSDDQKVRIWNLKTGKVIHTLSPRKALVNCLRYSSDGRLLATNHGGDPLVRLWNPTTGEQLATLAGMPQGAQRLCFSPDGKLLAACSENSVYVWEVESRRLVKTLTGHSALVWWFAFSPDGQSLATSSKDKTVKMWDIETAEVKATFAYSGDVHCVEFSADGRLLATADGKHLTLLRAALAPPVDATKPAK